jgi:hypothetical protein
LDFYCRLLLEKLEIPKNQWNKYLQAAQEVQVEIDPGIKNAVFLGTPVPQHEGTFLSSSILQELAALGIKTQAQAYARGIISLRTEDNARYSLIELNEYLEKRLEQMPNDSMSANWFEQLILAAKLVQLLLHEHLYLQNQITNLEMLVKEQDRLYAQLACFCLPPMFLKSIHNPVVFLEHIAPKLGRYLLYLHQG